MIPEMEDKENFQFKKDKENFQFEALSLPLPWRWNG